MIVAAIDTETTGLIESRLMRLELQPHVIQFAGVVVDLDGGKILDELELMIKPPRLDLVTKKITDLTGITREMLAQARPFSAYAEDVYNLIESAPCVAAHNLTFDAAMIDLEGERIGKKVEWPERRICTVEQSVHLKGYNPDLTTLHQFLLGDKFEMAHTAGADVRALVACLVEMRRREMI